MLPYTFNNEGLSLPDLKLKFPEGSTVYLKSGSPKLTVEWTRDDGYVPVIWFVGSDVSRDCFHPDALQY